MTNGQAAAALAELLARENAALARLDFASIGGGLAEKQATIAALGTAGPPLPPAQGRALHALALENRRLLESAMRVQQRVLGVVARAAPRAWQDHGGYGRRGTRPAKAPPVVLSARA